MPLASVILGLATILLWISFAWTLHQSRRAERRRSPHLLARLLGLLALTMTVSLLVPVLDPVLAPVLGARAAILVKNWLSVLDFAAALSFLSWTAGLDRPVVRTLVERAPAALAIVLMTVGWYASPPRARDAEFADPGLAPGMAVYWVTGLLYIGFGAGAAAVLLRRAAAISENRATTVGLGVAGLGFAVVAVFLAFARLLVMGLVATSVAIPGGIADTALVLERCGILLIGIGLLLPAGTRRVVTGRIWLRHRRLHGELEFLWRRLAGAFPGLVLLPEPSGHGLDLLRPGAVHQRFYRRVTECRDGLVLLAPHLPPGARLDDPAAEARAVLDALRACREELPTTDPGPVIADPGGPGVSDDARRLAVLAAHMRVADPSDDAETRGRAPS